MYSETTAKVEKYGKIKAECAETLIKQKAELAKLQSEVFDNETRLETTSNKLSQYETQLVRVNKRIQNLVKLRNSVNSTLQSLQTTVPSRSTYNGDMLSDDDENKSALTVRRNQRHQV
jgi:chromosome segregation ATPase